MSKRLIFLLIGLALTIGVAYFGVFYQSVLNEGIPEPERVSEAVLLDQYRARYWRASETIGNSMSPTIKDGDMSVKDTSPRAISRIRAGDVIAIQCREVCAGGLHSQDVQAGVVNIVKRVARVDDRNCWWLEGDNQKASHDSNDYGWVCPQDRLVYGVVVEVNGKPIK